jgi:cell division protein FtsL
MYSGVRLRPIDIILFTIILMLGVTGYIWSRLEVVHLGYTHQKLLSIKSELNEENKRLQLEYAGQIAPARIEQYARENIGLSDPSEKQFRYIK